MEEGDLKEGPKKTSSERKVFVGKQWEFWAGTQHMAVFKGTQFGEIQQLS